MIRLPYRLAAACLCFMLALGVARSGQAEGQCLAAYCLYVPVVRYPAPIRIVSSRVATQPLKGGGPLTLVSGLLLNTSQDTVYEVRVSADFYDAAGTLLHSETTSAHLPATFPQAYNYFTLVYPQTLPPFAHYELTLSGWRDVSPRRFYPVTVVAQTINNPPDGYSSFTVVLRNDQAEALENILVLYETGSGFGTLSVGSLAAGEEKAFTSALMYPTLRGVWQAQGHGASQYVWKIGQLTIRLLSHPGPATLRNPLLICPRYVRVSAATPISPRAKARSACWRWGSWMSGRGVM